nr:hypothetical protein [Tanacetum cinerariifolium]
MLQICPRIPNQPFDELPFEEEILAFLRELGHSGEIKMITDEYYAISLRVEPPKKKASVKKKQSTFDTTMPPPTAKGKRLKTLAKVDKPTKEKQSAKTSKAKVQTPSQVENTDDEDSHGINVEGDEGVNEEDDGNELCGDVNINLEGQDIQMAEVQTTHVIEDTHVTLTPVNPEDVSITITAEPPLLSATTLPLPSIPIISHVQQTLSPLPANVPSSSLQDLPNFGSLFGFDHRLRALETNFLEFMQTNQFTEAISSIPGIVDKYLDHQMNEVVKVSVQLQSERLRDEAQAENEDFLNKLDENIQKIINLSPTDLFELELKKILIDKMESNKSIHRSDEQKNLYKSCEESFKPI